MSKESVAQNLIRTTFNSIIQSYGKSSDAKPKKSLLAQKLTELLRTDGDDAYGGSLELMHERLTYLLMEDQAFMETIDKQRSALFKSSYTNTRIQLEELNQTILALSKYNGNISDNKFASIWDTFESCIRKTSDKTKVDALQKMRNTILSAPDDGRAFSIFENAMQSGPFKKAIEAKTGFGKLSSSESNTKQQLGLLLEWLRNPNPGQRADVTNLAAWMGGLPDDRKLGEIVAPGSHDAGVYNDPKDPANKPLARNQTDLPAGVCHTLSIYNQAVAGVRYFDVRFDDYGDGVYRATHDTKIGVSKASVKLGVWGATSTKILGDINKFLTENRTEVIYLKVTHTSDPILIRHVMTTLGDRVYSKRDHRNIPLPQVTLGAVRGKVIVLVEKKLTEKSSVIAEVDATGGDRREGFHGFKNLKGDKPTFGSIDLPTGLEELVIWGGNTSSMVSSSFSSFSSANDTNLVHGQIGKAALYYRHRKPNTFFQLSWTLMMGDVVAKSDRAHQLLPKLILYLLGQRQTAIAGETVFANIPEGEVFENEDRSKGYPNFIHMDNSNEDSSRVIIILNAWPPAQNQIPEGDQVFGVAGGEVAD